MSAILIGCFLVFILPFNTAAITPKMATTYTSHAVITVYGDSQLATVPGITGNGSTANPYIINGFSILGGGLQSCINISETDKCLIIENCDLEQGPSSDGALYLTDTQNVIVSNNQIIGNHGDGIEVFQGFLGTVSNVTIDSNNVSANLNIGIELYAPNVLVSNNIVDGNGLAGVDALSETNITITSNTISGNTGDGVSVDGNATVNFNVISYSGISSIGVYSTGNVINNNTCTLSTASAGDGIYIGSGGNSNQITRNYLYGGYYGIDCYGNTNTITSNILEINGEAGIELESAAAANTVSGNTICEMSGVSTISDKGTNDQIGTNTICSGTGTTTTSGTGSGSGLSSGIAGYPLIIPVVFAAMVGSFIVFRRKIKVIQH